MRWVIVLASILASCGGGGGATAGAGSGQPAPNWSTDLRSTHASLFALWHGSYVAADGVAHAADLRIYRPIDPQDPSAADAVISLPIASAPPEFASRPGVVLEGGEWKSRGLVRAVDERVVFESDGLLTPWTLFFSTGLSPDPSPLFGAGDPRLGRTTFPTWEPLFGTMAVTIETYESPDLLLIVRREWR